VKKLGNEPYIGQNSEIANTTFGIWTEVGPNNYLENCVLGDFSYTGPWCIAQNTVIGKFANIAASVRIGPTMHPMELATMHHFTYRRKMFEFGENDDTEFFARRSGRITRIGHDTWIGHGAIIMPGITVGNGSVIGAGAIVTKDVPEYTIVVGGPASALRKRCSEKDAAALGKIAWWDWDRETIKSRFDDFLLPIKDFIEKYTEEGSAS